MTETHIRNTTINLGPQHPSAHGVLRLVLEMDGEVIQRADPHIGQLHRGTEKLMEHKTYLQSIPYMDRLDYVAPLHYEHGWALAIEKMLSCDVPIRAQYIRVLFSEITRIIKHLFTFGAASMDVGAMTPLLWGFEQRDRLLEFIEAASGARFHANYIRPGGVSMDIPEDLPEKIWEWTEQFPSALHDIEGLVIENRIFKQRMVDIGSVTPEQALTYGFSGPNLRACGIPWDLRKSQPYEIYNRMEFDIPVGSHGDSYDRFLVRILECYESLKIIRQCLREIPPGSVMSLDRKVSPPPRSELKHSMEALIHHFKLYTEGYHVPAGESYTALETSAGEFGIYIVSDGTNRPYRVKLRPTGFAHLQAVHHIVKGHQLADVVAIMGSLDFVFGEVDR